MNRSDIEQMLGIKINNIDLYRTAFTHKSALSKYNIENSFETLEFMGDSILGFIITKFLFDKYRDRHEGFLTKARTKLVRGETLAKIGSRLGIEKWIIMDDKGMRNRWNYNPNVVEDVFESILGAMYLDLGLLHTKKFILGIFTDPKYVDMNCIMVDDNYKDILMRYCQMSKYELPKYIVDYHASNIFGVYVIVNGTSFEIASAKNKKQAEQLAAKSTLQSLKVSIV